MQTNIFSTNILNLEAIDKYDYYIPAYQRPYVWNNEQIKKLLDDFKTAFKNPSKETYYIGIILTKENGDSFELIDGQQRFTTLWLTALAICRKISNSPLKKFLVAKSGKIKLGFEIRNEVTEYLQRLFDDEVLDGSVLDIGIIGKYPYLKYIAGGLSFINSYINQLEDEKIELGKFADYIYRKVYFISNSAPSNTDLNKLFSTINSAGVQLEQTDIVKANLLNCLNDPKEKLLCGKIWEACENMHNFLEKNAKAAFPSSDWKNIDFTKLTEFNPSVFKHEAIHGQSSENIFFLNKLNLSDVNSYNPKIEQEDESKREESDDIFCRSIINFSQLLLHTYRLHLFEFEFKDFQGTFHSNRLIDIFGEMVKRNNNEEIIYFFRLLWQVRFLFDKYIVKWISDTSNKTESLEITNITRNDSNYSRTRYEKKSQSLMLQSVLYFTGDYLRQYWLTAYLYYLLYSHGDKEPTYKIHIEYLEKIDNIFSLNKSLTNKELSWLLMFGVEEVKVDTSFDFVKYLSEARGTGFQHYWFQKLEYILWKKGGYQANDLKFKNFRITSKNSVEHIYPQHISSIADEYLHSFGNLVLLNVSQNSEYSCKPYKVKKSMFEGKEDSYDSLKSSYIFEYDNWSTEDIIEHRDLMVKIIKDYYINGI